MSAEVEEQFEVDDLDAFGVLEAARENEQEIRRRESLKLRLAAHWADLHNATEDSGVETPGGPALDVLLADESLGGDGTPMVAAFTPEPFAHALGMSPSSAAQLIADALDLRHRLPLLWRRVAALEVPAWQARRVAQQTHGLPLVGARWVDDEISTRAGCGPVVLDRLVAHAIARFDPEEHERREDRGKASWDVKLVHPSPSEFAGTSELWARGDSVALQQVYELICAQAHQLMLDGDPDPLGARKAKALGDLGSAGDAAGRMKVLVHIAAEDLDVDRDGGSAFATGHVERLGPATLTKIRDWVGHHRVTIQPVLDPGRNDAVDHHDPPAWMRETVVLRDQHCVFPGCARDARSCDLDHVDPYVDPGDGGPPGQTRTENLAPLCRRHHRAKTSGLWWYTRTPDGRYLWRGPCGVRFLASP